jgi:hypothetical protein
MVVAVLSLPPGVRAASWEVGMSEGWTGVCLSAVRKDAEDGSRKIQQQYVDQYGGMAVRSWSVPTVGVSSELRMGYHPEKWGSLGIEARLSLLVLPSTANVVRGMYGKYQATLDSSESFTSHVWSFMPGVTYEVPLSERISAKLSAHAGGTAAWVDQRWTYQNHSYFFDSGWTEAVLPYLGLGGAFECDLAFTYSLGPTTSVFLEAEIHSLYIRRVELRKDIDLDGNGVVDYYKGSYLGFGPGKELAFDYSGAGIRIGTSYHFGR